MYTLANITNAECERTLERLGYPPRERLRITCLAIAHGVYTSKRIVIVHDPEPMRWTIVVRQG